MTGKTSKLKLIKGQDNLVLTDLQRERLIKKAAKQFGKFLTAMGYDWQNDPHMNDTPTRVTKAYVNELFSGNFHPEPKSTSFEDPDKVLAYGGMVTQTNITLKSTCSHHFLPFTGKCHVSYIPGEDGKVIGLSKLNRIADFCARRPQVQERLTKQILLGLKKVLPEAKGIAVTIVSKHSCCELRGIQHNSEMVTTELDGVYHKPEVKSEYFFGIQNKMNL